LKSRAVIACEGDGDSAFLSHLIETRSLGTFDVRIAKGNQFGQLLSGLQVLSDLERVLIVTDSDNDTSATFERIQGEIAEAGLVAPTGPLELSAGSPRVAVMLVPWHDEVGNLEVLCLRAMNDSHHEITACADAYVKCYSMIDTWPIGREAQLRIRIMLSSICTSDPNTSLRYAWSRPENCIDLTHACFDKVADAIRAFGDS
jgi:hypothetical protein